MARIQLRDTTVYFKDGLSGTGAIDTDTSPSDLTGETDLDVTSISLNTTDTDLVPIGARFTIAGETGSPIHTVTARTPATTGPTTNIEFTTAVASNVSDTAVLTFLPQQLQISIGEGDLSWTENREYNYDLDRDQLDTVRQGQDQPLELEMSFTFEYVTTESGQTITPSDALKQIGEASEWVTSSSDSCEPYAVDVYVLHCVPCGSDQDQDFTFPDFRWESLDYSIQDASVSVSGRCNATSVTTTRGSLTGCS